MSPTNRQKYKYFHSTVQRAKDRRQKFHFCRLPFDVRPLNVKLNLSNRDMTETGNCARKTSGTQGSNELNLKKAFPPRMIVLFLAITISTACIDFWLNWHELCKSCGIIKSKWPHKQMLPLEVLNRTSLKEIFALDCQIRHAKLSLHWSISVVLRP